VRRRAGRSPSRMTCGPKVVPKTPGGNGPVMLPTPCKFYLKDITATRIILVATKVGRRAEAARFGTRQKDFERGQFGVLLGRSQQLNRPVAVSNSSSCRAREGSERPRDSPLRRKSRKCSPQHQAACSPRQKSVKDVQPSANTSSTSRARNCPTSCWLTSIRLCATSSPSLPTWVEAPAP
jgi:hypothetical protein